MPRDLDWRAIFLIFLFVVLPILQWIGRKVYELSQGGAAPTRRPSPPRRPGIPPVPPPVSRNAPQPVARTGTRPNPPPPPRPPGRPPGLEDKQDVRSFLTRLRDETSERAVPKAPPVSPPAAPRPGAQPARATPRPVPVSQARVRTRTAMPITETAIGTSMEEGRQQGPQRPRPRAKLHSASELRRYIVWSEILAAPVSLRAPSGSPVDHAFGADGMR